MSTHHETNVRLLPCVIDALKAIADRRGVSRDEAVRQVLAEHVCAQEAREPDHRLTHISTVLRYPQPGREAEQIDRPLRLRLPAGMAERAREVSLRLPGQHRRAHKDYQSRSLTDAVVTAIAVQEPFTDEMLDGLHALLRHRAALALWQLVVAATSSGQERALQAAAERIRLQPPGPRSPEDNRLLLVAEALDDEVSWHSWHRFEVARHIAAEDLHGTGAAEFEQLLFDQTPTWDLEGRPTWGLARFERQISREAGEWFKGVPDANVIGRGATAVWRARRRVELQDFEDWLGAPSADRRERRRVVQPPGWRINVPAEWQAVVLPRASELPTQVARWVESGEVLVLPFGSRSAVWPLGAGGSSPVAGAEPLVAAARKLKPQDLTAFVESMLIEWGTPLASANEVEDETPEDDDPDDPWASEARQQWAEFDAAHKAPQLWIPVEKAFQHGLIDATQRRDAMAAARRNNLNRSSRRRLGESSLAAPVTTPDPQVFLFIPRKDKNRLAKPMWRWPEGSIAQAVTAQVHPELVGCLVEAAVWTTGWTLNRVMNQVWRAAFLPTGKPQAETSDDGGV